MVSGRIAACLDELASTRFNPLDLLPHGNLAEKLIELALRGVPAGRAEATAGFAELAELLAGVDTADLNVVVFGGGTGLSNLIGGDSRNPDWPRLPFQGLKELFPKTRSIVCVTDDGGSTGELLKDLSIIALGDLRHVLLSSIRKDLLQKLYGLTGDSALQTAAALHRLLNHRYQGQPDSLAALFDRGDLDLELVPAHLRQLLTRLLEGLFSNCRLRPLLDRPHCLGNLLLVAAIHRHVEGERITPAAITHGIRDLAGLLGASPDAVWPCTTTPAELKMMYTNGVLVSGEYKSAHARRGYAVDRVFVEFAGEPEVPPEVLASIRQADLIIFAPGSLFSSMVPVLHVPGLAEAVRGNRQALKILVANLWAQKGETDLVFDDPGRRFYVSDLIRAYHRNIPGGVRDLFEQVLALGFQDVPGSILQSYALEDKVPIYLDRSRLTEMGFATVEARVFSEAALRERRVIQHDPAALATAVRTLWAVRGQLPATAVVDGLPPCYRLARPVLNESRQTPHERLRNFERRLKDLAINGAIGQILLDILWRHRDILVEHLDGIAGLRLVERKSWRRCQEWDKIYSFYQPEEKLILIREDMRARPEFFEIAFLVALGQSLLGNYAGAKEMAAVESRGDYVGKVFRLTLRPAAERLCFFTPGELDAYLALARMIRAPGDELLYTRLLNGNEQFTPPGMLFGLTYAWYLDNRHAAHIEYKMAITKTELSDLIPGQVKMLRRREALIDFFRRIVFRQRAEAYDEGPEEQGR